MYESESQRDINKVSLPEIIDFCKKMIFELYGGGMSDSSTAFKALNLKTNLETLIAKIEDLGLTKEATKGE